MSRSPAPCVAQAGSDAPPDALDCLIIGGGPAGLTASIYLARFRRTIVTIDAGASRALWIPVSHNHAGFPEGVHGRVLLDRMKAQAALYGASIVTGSINHLERRADGLFEACTAQATYVARTVLLTTGVIDRAPDLPDLYDAVQRGLVRYCPICDGYEARERDVAVLGDGMGALGEALFLRTYSDRVTMLTTGEPLSPSAAERERIEHAGLRMIQAPIAEIHAEDRRLRVVTRDGASRCFDTLYAALGTLPRSDLAREMGARLDDCGCVVVDAHQQSSVDGLYSAGDVVSALDQISVAMGQAAIAATTIHNRLRQQAGMALPSRPAHAPIAA